MKLKQILIFLSVFEVIMLVLHAVIYFVTIFLFGIESTDARITLAIILGVLAFSFAASMAITWQKSSLIGRILYRLSAAWMTFVYFLSVAAVISILLYAILPLQNHSVLLASLFYGLAAACGIYALINSEVIRITRHAIKLPSVPEFWNGKTITFISDIHLGNIHGSGYAARITKKLNTLQTQAVFIGGDIFDGPKIDPAKAVEPFRDVHVPLGTYFISGNHDEFRDSSEFFHAIKNIGIRILDAESVTLEGITFTGVDYLKTNSREKFQEALEKITLHDGPNILLKHVPDHLDLAAAKGFNASFSGHTHNGQMYPLGLMAKRMYGFNYGLKMLNTMNVLVSSGVGTWGPQGRFGTKSEIVVISFQ